MRRTPADNAIIKSFVSDEVEKMNSTGVELIIDEAFMSRLRTEFIKERVGGIARVGVLINIEKYIKALIAPPIDKIVHRNPGDTSVIMAFLEEEVRVKSFKNMKEIVLDVSFMTRLRATFIDARGEDRAAVVDSHLK